MVHYRPTFTDFTLSRTGSCGDDCCRFDPVECLADCPVPCELNVAITGITYDSDAARPDTGTGDPCGSYVGLETVATCNNPGASAATWYGKFCDACVRYQGTDFDFWIELSCGGGANAIRVKFLLAFPGDEPGDPGFPHVSWEAGNEGTSQEADFEPEGFNVTGTGCDDPFEIYIDALVGKLGGAIFAYTCFHDSLNPLGETYTAFPCTENPATLAPIVRVCRFQLHVTEA